MLTQILQIAKEAFKQPPMDVIDKINFVAKDCNISVHQVFIDVALNNKFPTKLAETQFSNYIINPDSNSIQWSFRKCLEQACDAYINENGYSFKN